MSVSKVLFAGPVEGRLDALYARVAAVNKTSGPFVALFCLGRFLEEGQAESEDIGELGEYLVGDKRAPVPTFFVDGRGKGSSLALSALGAAEGRNITFLGGGGGGASGATSGLEAVSGLSVAYVNPGGDLAPLRQALASSSGDVDVLLTCEWSPELARGGSGAEPPAGPDGAAPATSPEAGRAAQLARPRYHVAAGSTGSHWLRPPYANPDAGAGPSFTRFVGLAPVGNQAKARWLHALGLTPASRMSAEATEAAAAPPPGTTASPYEGTSGDSRGAAGKRSSRDLGPEPNPFSRGGEGAEGGEDWRWGGKRQALGPVAAPSRGRAGVVRDRRKTVFLRNLSYHASEEDVLALFSEAGLAVEDYQRGTHASGGRGGGGEGGPPGEAGRRLNSWALAQLSTPEEAVRALELDGRVLAGKAVGVEASRGPAEGAGAGGAAAPGAHAVSTCWFCLSSENADVGLVASVGEGCYLALDKGPIDDSHALVVSVEHHACTLALPAEAALEQARYLAALASSYAAEGKAVVAFERYVVLRRSGGGGNHCHVNAIAVPSARAAEAAQVFERVSRAHGLELEALPAPSPGPDDGAGAGTAPTAESVASLREQLRNAVGDGEYFVALLPDGSRLVRAIRTGERHPLQLGREALAELVGRPERADWRACKEGEGDEAARVERFKATFDAFDPAAQA